MNLLCLFCANSIVIKQKTQCINRLPNVGRLQNAVEQKLKPVNITRKSIFIEKKYFCGKDWSTRKAVHRRSEATRMMEVARSAYGSAKTIYAASFSGNDTIYDCVKR